MSTNGPSEITAEASRGRPDGALTGVLHALALIAVIAGAVGSVGFMLWVGIASGSQRKRRCNRTTMRGLV